MQTATQIKQSLERASDTVRRRPNIGKRTYVSHAIVTDGLACHVNEKDHDFHMDVPNAMGGENAAASPAAYLRAAMSSCVAMGIKMWAARLDVIVNRIEVRFEMDVDARGQLGVCSDVSPGFNGIRLLIDIASPADQKTVEHVVETSMRYSPLVDVFRPHGSLETQINVSYAIAA